MKKILFNYYSFGNMDFLESYYINNLKQTYENKIKIINTRDFKPQGKVGKFLLSLSKYDVVVSDYPTKLFSAGKKSVYICHGYGTKQSPGKDEVADKVILEKYKKLKEQVEYVITLSPRDEGYFLKNKELSHIEAPEYIPLGLPRNDVLFTKEYVEENNKLVKEKFKAIDKTTILFCPTWRGYSSEKSFPFTKEDFEKLNNYLGKNNYLLLYRPHPIEDIFPRALIDGLENIVFAGSDKIKNTQSLLCGSDILITDYSSIYVDYLALNRPMAFIPYDEKQYNEFRGLVIDFKNKVETPGPNIESMEALISYLEAIKNKEDSFEEYREKSRELFYTYLDNNSCKRIWNFILETLEV